MAKETGLAWDTLSVDDSGGTLQDIKNDITNLEFATPRGIQDVTGLNSSAYERLLLLVDMSTTLNGVFNDAATYSHAVFSTAPSTSVAREFNLTVSGQKLGFAPVITLLPTDYSLSRANTGELTWTVPMSLANGLVPTWTT